MGCCHGIAGHLGTSLMIWPAQRSGGRPLGRRHDEGGVEEARSLDVITLDCKKTGEMQSEM